MGAECACSSCALLFPQCVPPPPFSKVLPPILFFSHLSHFGHVCWKYMLGQAYVLILTYGYTHRHATHSAELHSTQGTIPPWPQWLITFNKANRVLLVRINLFSVLVRGAVTSNCQTLCSMKWGPLSPLPGPKLTIASIFYACVPALLAPVAPLWSPSSSFLFLYISTSSLCNAAPSSGARLNLA